MVEALARSVLGAHFGLVESLVRVHPEDDDVPVAVYASRLANTAAFAGVEVPRAASGAGLTESHAEMACIGEAVERYAAGLVRSGAIRAARAGDLEGAVVPPDRFALFSREQYRRWPRRFPFAPWTSGLRCGWVEARSLTRARTAWVPAAFVFQPYRRFPGELPIAPGLSTGLACGSSVTDATVRALCEVIERDAVALAWLCGIAPPRLVLDPAALGAGARRLVGELEERGFRWRAFDLTTDLGVPVVAALIEGHSPVGNVVSFGSAAHARREEALTKALVEAAHCRIYVKSLLRAEPGWRAGRQFERVRTFADHARLYSSHPELRPALERWWRTPRAVLWPPHGEAVPAGLEEYTARLARSGLEVLVVELTTPDVAELGLAVVRVLVPGLQPLHGNHAWPHLGGARLREPSRVFGPEVRRSRRGIRYPHPCP
jgi:ribosomal protein S12 methylthiotransferase accessory factor